MWPAEGLRGQAACLGDVSHDGDLHGAKAALLARRLDPGKVALRACSSMSELPSSVYLIRVLVAMFPCSASAQSGAASAGHALPCPQKYTHKIQNEGYPCPYHTPHRADKQFIDNDS